MPAPALDLPSLHYLLWTWSDPETHTLRVNQKQLAEDLCVSAPVLNRTFVTLEREGRLTVVTKGAGRAKLYEIIDPLLVA